MEKQDHYTILGISRTANKDAIRQAYKLKALQLHPDKNPDGADVFKLVVNAYQTLNDPSKRSAYDRELTRRDRGGFASRMPHSSAQSNSPNAAYPSSSSPHGADGGGAHQSHFGSDEQIFKDAYDQYKKNPFSGAPAPGFRGSSVEGTFAEWFKKKQEELRKAEEIARAKTQHAKSLEREEQRRAEEWREMQRRREEEVESELRMAQETRESERELNRRLHAEEDRAAQVAVQMARMEENAEVQRAQQTEVERHLRDLASQKRELAEERRRLADEREMAAQAAMERRNSRGAVQQQRERELADAVRRADNRVRAAQEQIEAQETQHRVHAAERLREEQRAIDELERVRAEERTRERQRKEEEAVATRQRRRATEELGMQRQRVMEQMLSERKQHEEEVLAMRRETDRIEAEMKAKLEALRAAKSSGQTINLDEWKL